MRRGGVARAARSCSSWIAWDTDADPVRLVRGLPWMWDFVRRMLPPDLARPARGAQGRGRHDRDRAARDGAGGGAGACRSASCRRATWRRPAVYYAVRAALNFFRSIDTLVYALLFVAAVGLGPFPGMLAVVAYTTTSLAKLYSETIEGIEPGPVDAIRATGATRLQVLRFGVLPQVLPLFLSYVLYRFESNIRAATVLGFVGAGGIGLYLQTYLRMIDYPAASTVLLVTVAMVMVVDFASARIRARLV